MSILEEYKALNSLPQNLNKLFKYGDTQGEVAGVSHQST